MIPPISTVARLGAHLPLSTRRVVTWCGQTTEVATPIGLVGGMADGVILIRIKGGPSFELAPSDARELSSVIQHAAYGVERWQETASGFNRVRVSRSEHGLVTVTHRGRTRPMRLSTLRGTTYGDGSVHYHRACGVCRKHPKTIYVAADDLREHGSRVRSIDVCEACVDKLANRPEHTAALVQIGAKSP